MFSNKPYAIRAATDKSVAALLTTFFIKPPKTSDTPMLRAIVIFSFLFSMLASASSHALQLTLSQTQVNAMLAGAFPLTRSYEGVNFRFSEPLIKINASDDSVSIKTLIVAERQGKLLKANGTIGGVIEYDPAAKVLNIVKPSLREFNLIDNQIVEAEQALEVLKQSVGKSLPMILLVDFTQFDLGFFQALPKNVDIAEQGIILYF